MNEKEALAWLAELFEEPTENVGKETVLSDLEGWDSLGVLNLMAGMDETFEILLTDDEIQGFSTIDEILNILRDNGKLEA